jgi:hypothetical protein
MPRLFLLLAGFLAATAVAAWGLSSTRPLASHSPTAQAPDLLLFQGDTLAIYTNPLEAYFEQGRERPDEFFPECMSTGCWRDYQAFWQIDEEHLYLRTLQSCCDAGVQLSANKLDSLLAGRYESGRAFAQWFTGTLPAPQGELLKYVHMGYGSIYEREVHFHIENGRLVGRDTVSNVPTRDPQFPGGLDSLRAFVYRHLDWTAVPHPDTGTAVIPIVEIDTTGKARIQRIFRTSRPDTEAEIRRVFEQLPQWQIGYHKGKKITFSFGFPIPLSDSLRRLHTQ